MVQTINGARVDSLTPVNPTEVIYKQIEDLRPALVSFDVFDTLLWRPFRRPIDLFPHLVPSAVGDNAGSRFDPGEVARQRVQAECGLRRKVTSMEVTLEEIAAELASRLGGVDRAALVQAELELERSHLQPHVEMFQFMAELQQQGIPYVLCSDTYLPSIEVAGLVRVAAHRVGVTIADPRFVLVSCENRSGKAGTLYDALLRKANLAPEKILHIGDNREADYHAPRRRGIAALHLPRTCDYAERLLDAEEGILASWQGGGNDFGLSVTRKQLLAEKMQASAGALSHYIYGIGIVGPVFAAFADWVVSRCQERGISRVYCPMREGAFLSRLLKLAAGSRGVDFQVETLWASRFAFRSAGLAGAGSEDVVQLLSELRMLLDDERMLENFGILSGEDERLWQEEGMSHQPWTRKVAWIRNLFESDPARLERLRDISSRRAQGLMRFLEKEGLFAEEEITLVDLGWGGSLQRGLREALASHGKEVVVRGFYLATNSSIAGLPGACPWESFLCRAGQPAGESASIRRSAELIEQFCMAPSGSLKEFTPEGQPVLFSNSLPPVQLQQMLSLQEGAWDFARHWLPRLRQASGSLSSVPSSDSQEARLRSILTRAIEEPLAEEVSLFAEWRHDCNSGSTSAPKLLGTQKAFELVGKTKVRHPHEVLWPSSYWPQALFVALGRPWNRRLSGRTRILIRIGDLSARVFGRLDPWPKVLRVWLAVRLRLRDGKHAALARMPRFRSAGRT